MIVTRRAEGGEAVPQSLQKFVACAVVVGLSIGVAACGSSGTAGEEQTAKAEGPNPAYATHETLGTHDQLVDMKTLCPKKETTVAIADGNGGNTWRRIARQEMVEEASKCPNIKTVYTDAQA